MQQHFRACLLGLVGFTTIAAVLAACSGTGKDDTVDATNGLSSETNSEWILETDSATGAITFAMPKNGAFALPSAASLDVAALTFLDAHKGTFGMKDPRKELVLSRIDTSDGHSHVRFDQEVNGVPVDGAQWIAHFDEAGRLMSMSGHYQVGASTVGTQPAIDSATAKSAAIAVVPADPDLEAEEPVLEISSVDGTRSALSWSVRVSAPGMLTIVHVDATSGGTVFTSNGIKRVSATGKAPQTYPPFNQTAPDMSFLVDEATPPTMNGKTTYGVPITTKLASKKKGGGPVVVSVSNNPWTDKVKPQGAAVAAQANGQVVLDYLNARGWKSYDNKGGTLTSFVNDNASGIDNAYWSGADQAMHYGDGAVDRLEWPTSSSLDTVGHEIFHGVIEHTAGLDGPDGAEANALNESLADTFAAFITHRIRHDDAKDFTFSEDDNNAGVPMRSMIQPSNPSLREKGGYSSIGERPKSGKKEEHNESNIPSHAFYLLVHGGVHEKSRIVVPCGLGWETAEKVYWKTLTTSMTPKEKFRDFALHLLATARANGVTEAPIVCAFVGAGVLKDDEAKKNWNTTCQKEGADGGTGSDAGGDAGGSSLLSGTPSNLIECPPQLGSATETLNGTGSL